MIQLVEALNYRCLRYIRQNLDPFHVLVGPNASGKTTFLDVFGFLGHLVSEGVEASVSARTQNFDDLLWGRTGDSFELAIEARIPDQRKTLLGDRFAAIRYEVRIGRNQPGSEIGIVEERAWLKPASGGPDQKPAQREFFPTDPTPPRTILTGKARVGWQRVISKALGGNDNFYVEVRGKAGGKGWFPSIRLGPRKSALANLPDDESRFPVATWLRSLLIEGIQTIMLNSLRLRQASPPGQGYRFKPDGSNLPWVVRHLEQHSNTNFKNWMAHVRTALPDIDTLHVIEREDDKHRYLAIRYKGGLLVPSWMASDGTLRLLCLTLPAYLPEVRAVYLIEEPENGIHPLAIETVLQSLSSVYDAQVLLATHSPVILSLVEPRNVLCFKKSHSGATDIVRGSDHPGLREWKGETNLGMLFAAGVLG